MIDPIGMKPGAIHDRRPATLEPVDRLTPSNAVSREAGSAAAEPAIAAVAREMAAAPPVDLERVAQIKRALEEGRFPIVPAKIADRLIAASMIWTARR